MIPTKAPDAAIDFKIFTGVASFLSFHEQTFLQAQNEKEVEALTSGLCTSSSRIRRKI